MNTSTEIDQNQNQEENYKDNLEAAYYTMITQKLFQLENEEKDKQILILEKKIIYDREVSVMAVNLMCDIMTEKLAEKDEEYIKLEERLKNDLMEVNITRNKMAEKMKDLNMELNTRECVADSHIRHISQLLRQIDVLESQKEQLTLVIQKQTDIRRNKIYCEECCNDHCNCSC